MKIWSCENEKKEELEGLKKRMLNELDTFLANNFNVELDEIKTKEDFKEICLEDEFDEFYSNEYVNFINETGLEIIYTIEFINNEIQIVFM